MTDFRHGVRNTFIGRGGERRLLAEVIAGARTGHSASLVIRAAAGLGKTYLLGQIIETEARGMRVLSVTGAESELVLDYAGLQQVCAPLREFMSKLPTLQHHSLQVATGAEAGPQPDPFLVGLALVNLLSEAGAVQPTLCVVDDAQWIDDSSRQAFAFAARRLLADHVGLIFATRADATDHLEGLPQLMLPPLTDSEARALLGASLPGRLDRRIRERLLIEAGGNPLALTVLPRALTPADIAGGYGLGGGGSLTTGIEQAFARRCQALPDPTRTLLLVAAAEPIGEPTWLWAAAERLSVSTVDAAPAEQAGLITLDSRIWFRHPLVRSAVYRTAPAAHRHQVHQALADTITGPDAADYCAWHRGHATNVPREDIAEALVDSAERARQRGGIAAAAAFLERAVDLTPDPGSRRRRGLEAATAKLDAGDAPAAARLIEQAASGTRDDEIGAQAVLLRAKLAFATDRGRATPRLLLDAARRITEFAPQLARDTYLEALMAAMIVGRLASDDGHGPEQIALAARNAPPAPSPPRAVDLLLDGLISRFVDGYVAAAPVLKNALHAYVREVNAGTADPRWHDITNRICLDLFDFHSYKMLAFHQLDQLRAAGELTVLPAALATAAAVQVLDGDFDQAETLLDEALVVSTATGAPPHRSMDPFLAAYRGDEELWRPAAKTTLSEADERGEGTEVTVVHYAGAVMHNGMQRFSEALDSCRTGWQYSDTGLYVYLLVEAVEAAAGAGDLETAREVTERFATYAAASPTESAMGLAARCRALAAGDDAEDDDYRRAITHLERSPLAVYRARTHLIYGEWLRRQRRNGDARTYLRQAYDLCNGMGAEGFAHRAYGELEAAGGSSGMRGRRYSSDLTAQERYICRLAQERHTNAEIAAQLLISHRTVEWHLRNIYGKLGVSSRRELRLLGETNA